MRAPLENNQFPFDPQLQKTKVRPHMQTDAESTHVGEPRWHLLDANCFENMSSKCSIITFFIGYGCAEGKEVEGATTSKVGQVEHLLRWDLLPPLSRKDNMAEQNAVISARNVAAGRSSTF